MAPNSPESFRDLGEAVKQLFAEVHTLNENFELSRKQAAAAEDAAKLATQAVDQAKNLTRWLIGLTVLSLIVATVTIALYIRQGRQSHDLRAAISQIQADAVTACENGNERSEGTKAPWLVFIGVAKATALHPTPGELDGYKNFTDYINALYSPRDCSDLTKKYHAPSPPDLSGFAKH